MTRILKYRINEKPEDFGEVSRLALPSNVRIIHFAMQDNLPTIWGVVDDADEQIAERNFRVVGTGHDIEDGEHHVATTIDEPFVWHLVVESP